MLHQGLEWDKLVLNELVHSRQWFDRGTITETWQTEDNLVQQYRVRPMDQTWTGTTASEDQR